MEMDDPSLFPSPFILSSSSVPCTLTFNTCPLLSLSCPPMSVSHLNHTHTNHPPTHLMSYFPPHYLLLLSKYSPFSAHLRTPVSRLISDWAMWQAAGGEKGCRWKWKCQTTPGGHDSVCLSRSATLFSFISPWFHPPFTSKIPTFSLSLSC